MDDKNNLTPLLTIPEAAEQLRVHPEIVRRMVTSGELSAVRLGRAVRIDPKELEQLIQDSKTQEPDDQGLDLWESEGGSSVR